MIPRSLTSLLALGVLAAAEANIPPRSHIVDAVRESWARGEHFVGAGGHVHRRGERNGPPVAVQLETRSLEDPSAVEFDLGDSCRHSARKKEGSETVCLLPKSGSKIEVRFRRRDGKPPGDWDWIALYNPGDWKDDNGYVEWYWVPANRSSEAESWYSVTFSLLNLRQPYGLRYFERYRRVAKSPMQIDFQQGLFEPTQGHMQWTMREAGDYAVRVTWTSGVPHLAGRSSAMVQASITSSDGNTEQRTYAMADAARSGRYEAGDLCESPANVSAPGLYRDVGYFHSVVLEGVPPDSRVSYRFGQREQAMSGEFTWETPKKKELSGEEKWSFLAYADHGVAGTMDNNEMGSHTPGSFAVNENVRRLALSAESRKINPRFALHFGDLAYAMSVGYVWESWLSEIEQLAATRPYMVSVGNHEYDHEQSFRPDGRDPSNVPDGAGFHPSWGNHGRDSGGECGVPVHFRFPMDERRQHGGNGVFWYAFDYGQVQIVQISSEHDFTRGSEQYNWLEQVLKKQMAINSDTSGMYSAKDKRWLVVTAHRPGYNSLAHAADSEVGRHLSQELDLLLQSTGVHLFLAGHYHAYERTCAVAHGKCADDARGAPVHITVGSAGAWKDSAGYWEKDWSVSRHVTFGFLNLELDGLNTIRVDFWGLNETQAHVLSGMDKAAVPDFQVLDSVSVPFERVLHSFLTVEV